ncbi:TonB-dependent receptor [Shinella curvata]|uniref:TonB-dependent receptor n=1 Tax=Shinella curvata TaxID=1817964 RepID=A0ABT8XAE1_9HYPH|nr:TonB-dependent receptor [Shinella curvata]MCJ8055195.1 TonB-dependent receptor [Shinella curvata]MDO6120409.1 TonB-dependent receptor [Shinella curvata]
MLATALVALAASVHTVPGHEAWAQQATTGRLQPGTYNIPSQPLSSALVSFARVSGLKIAYPATLTEGKTSSAAIGPYTRPGALEQILSGSGLSYSFTGDNAVTVFDPRQANTDAGGATGATALETIVIAGDGAMTENTGSYTTKSMATATGLALSIRETPQAVAVVSRQRLTDQRITSVEDAMVNAPGVIFKKKATADDNEKGLFARSMEITNMQVDGVNMHKDFKALSLDTALYDRIEIVRGSTGLMSGTGNPAASVNLYRKKPTDAFQAEVNGTVGSWSMKRTEFDVGGPVNADGSVRARMVGAWQDGQSYIDRLEEDSRLLYGVVEMDLADSTMLTLSGEYQRKHCTACSYFGFPGVFADGSHTDFPVSFNSATNWSRQTRTRTNLSATLDHEFENDWKGSVTVSRSSDNNDRTYGWFSDNGLADPVTGKGASLWLAKWPIPKTQLAVDANISGPFELMGREHDLVLGLNASRTRADYTMYPLWFVPGYDPTVPDVFNWDGNMPEPDWVSTGKRRFLERQASLYGATRLKPTDDLSVILGSRVTWFDQKASYDYIEWGPYPDNMSEKGKIIPYAGLVYDLTDNLSVYASYTSIFQPQQNQTVDGMVLDPLTGNTYEVGLKGSFFDDRLNAGVSLFQSKQNNYAVLDGDKMAPNGDNAYVAADGARIRGIEFDLSGEILPDWQVQASYAYVSPQMPDGFDLNVGLPRHTAKLFTTYRLPGDWEKLTIGGGVRFESESSFVARGTFAKPVYSVQEKFFIVDLMAKYDFNEKTSAVLNIRNLFDKKYYSSTNVYSNFYGEPLNASFSLSYKF